MKMHPRKYHFSFMLSLAFVYITNAQRQPPPPIGEDAPVVPIDGVLYFIFFLAIFLGYYITVHHQKKENL